MKKKNHILIGGSSFLLPKYNYWKRLKLFKLSFAEYNNLNYILDTKENYYCRILIVFFEDLIQNDHNGNIRTKFLISSIKKFLEQNSENLMICYCDYYSDNTIKNSKIRNKIYRINDEFKKNLYSLAKKYNNLSILDLDIIFKQYGYKQILDKRNWYLAHSRLSEFGLKILIDQIINLLNNLNKPASKVLILDCDNTLWGGVVGEDGIFGVNIGTDGEGLIFKEFQDEIVKLKKNGVILAISSKNNEKDVFDVFKKNLQMRLKKKDISIFKVNWEEKYINIRKISEELNLGLDSFVFWDDNPIERKKVQVNLPEVKVADVPSETYEWVEKLRNCQFFLKPITTKEDFLKTKQYRAAAKFNEDKRTKKSHSFLKQISIKPKFFRAKKNNINRFSQMTLKTNQFNLRSIRMSEIDVNKLFKKKIYTSFMCEVKDIYGDHGIIGLSTIKKLDNKIYFLENFLMSCRILGRNIEYWFLEKMLQYLKNEKAKMLIIGFIPSERNEVAKQFIDSMKLKPLKNLKDHKILKYNNKERFFVKDIKNFNFTANKFYE